MDGPTTRHAGPATRPPRPNRGLAPVPSVLLAGFLSVPALWLPTGTLASGPQVTPAELSNGVRLLISEQPALPMVLVHVLVDAGARLDPPDRAGVANLTADLLTEGTSTRSAAAISESVDFIGASLRSSASTDFAAISLKVLKKDLDVGLDLLADVLLRPAFLAAELARRREAVLAAIRAARDDPGWVASKAFQQALYGTEPYGHPVEGTETTIPRISRGDIRAFYASHYRPARTTVVVVGDITAGAAQTRLERALAGWQGDSGPPFRYPDPARPAARRIEINKAVTQASIVLGHRGVARNSPDYEALSVMNYVLGGGGFSSRLMESIRTQAGLAYSVGSFFTANKAPGSFQITMQTKNRSAAEAIARARREVERIRTEPIGDDELDEARRYLTGSFPLRLDSNAEIAQFVAEVAFYDLGLDYAEAYARRINAVTKEDVLRVARRYLHPEQFIEVVVADLAEAKLAGEPGPTP